jgi:quercetin dioxygenase-like cupin family protein
MTTTLAPIAHGPDQGEARWFLGQLVTTKSWSESTAGRVGVTETLAPRGSGSPVHVHHNEDGWFYVIEGELAFWVGGQVIVAPAGSFVYGPRDIPHTFTVTSDQARVPARRRTGRIRGLRAHAVRARGPARDPARPDRAARHGGDAAGRRRVWARAP